ncbi:MAG: hypothetical protein OHK0037_16750 [Elainellaceae cyanobacterium]
MLLVRALAFLHKNLHCAQSLLRAIAIPTTMLTPITEDVFKQLIPAVATAQQYRYYWGKFQDVLSRVLISVVGALLGLVLRAVLPANFWFEILEFSVAIVAGLYWLWGPAYKASRRNAEYRRYPYGGFWQGEVSDVYITEELVGTEERVNKQGELVVVENRERRLNLELADEAGYLGNVQVPLVRDHRVIRPGDRAQLVVISNRPDLDPILELSDVYMADYGLWVSDYPYLSREVFAGVSKQLSRRASEPGPKRRRTSAYEPAYDPGFYEAPPRRSERPSRPRSADSLRQEPPRSRPPKRRTPRREF